MIFSFYRKTFKPLLSAALANALLTPQPALDGKRRAAQRGLAGAMVSETA